MPPELLLEGRLSKGADVYAFGVVLYELFTADRPWSGLRHAEVLHRVAVKREQLQLPTNAPQPFQVSRQTCCSTNAIAVTQVDVYVIGACCT